MPFLRLLALLLILPLAAPAQDAAPSEPSGTIQTESDRASDARIATRIREILAELGGYEDVTVTVADGIVRVRGETETLDQAEALDPLISRVEGVVAIRNDVAETAEVARRIDTAMGRFTARFWQIVTALPLLLIAGAALAVIAFIGHLASSQQKLWDRLAPNAFIGSLYSQIVFLAFLVVGVVVALDLLGASALLGTILGAAGIVGLAVGFAVRDTVENYIASIMLSIRQPFRPNDVIEIGGDEGKVIRLTSRATILLSFDGNQIRIPNSTVFKSRIVNYSTNPERRFLFEIGVASDADLSAVRHLALEVLTDLPFTLAEPAPQVWIDRIGDGAIFLKVAGWIDQRETNLVLAKGEALRMVKHAIEAAGVEVPDTTYRIDILGAGKALVTAAEEGAPSPPPPTAPPAPPEPAVSEDVGTSAEDALDRLVDDERKRGERRDLLDDHAPVE